jgi:hypothetical protein
LIEACTTAQFASMRVTSSLCDTMSAGVNGFVVWAVAASDAMSTKPAAKHEGARRSNTGYPPQK